MMTRLFGALALVAATAGTGALAQTPANAAPPRCATPTAAVGRWLHDPQGTTIGSVRALTDGGHSAVIMIGSYFEPGSHEAVVPACEISIADGQVTLHSGIAEALNAPSRQR